MNPWERPGAALSDEDEDGVPGREPGHETASGSESAAEDPDAAAPDPDAAEPDAGPRPGEHLCPSCAHAMVCGIATAIMAAGGEGSVVVSKCGAFIPERALAAAYARIPGPAAERPELKVEPADE